MFQLPGALQALAAHRQFIVYRLAPGLNGKTAKYPTSWLTGQKHDAHDPTIWLSCSDAAAAAENFGAGYGVGFVFTPHDPFFFVDIDSCLIGNDWSASAREILNRFPGAAVEISQSGKGLHIIGSGSYGAGPPPPARKTRCDTFELYTENRFVALTGTGAIGDAATDHAAALGALVGQYLKPESVAVDGEWTTEPDPRWNGPDDDEKLIQRALMSASAANRLGGRASFADLWHADEHKLTMFFPDPERPYNASSADSALAQLLAFWTGKNCERIQRIMLMSGLVREKWEREDYLPRTILAVVARQHDVLTDDRHTEIAAIPPGPSLVPMGSLFTGDAWLPTEAQIAFFRGCVYILDKDRALVPGGKILKPTQFKANFGGYVFPLDIEGKTSTKDAWEAFLQNQCFRSPHADSATFRPECAPGELIEEAGQKLVNVWWPIETPRQKGDPSPFLKHMEKMLPVADDRNKLLAYMAACLQYPGKKFQWAPLIQGVEGNGKTFLLHCMIHGIGERYAHLPKVSSMAGDAGRFTGWIERKLFVGLEEIKTDDRRQLMDELKPMITNTRLEIQYKGQDQITGDNRANFMALTNFKDAIPKNLNDRRWAIFYTAQQEQADLIRGGFGGEYMPNLWTWARNGGFAIVNEYLRSYAIPDELNPATQMHRAPETSSTSEAVALSLGSIEQDIVEAVEQNMPGFIGGWIASNAVDQLLRSQGLDRRIPHRKRRELLEGLGYVIHPALSESDGRVTAMLATGGKPRLYIKKGHILGNLPRDMVAKKYVEDQAQPLLTQGTISGNKLP
jgi:hypothetical protein